MEMRCTFCEKKWEENRMWMSGGGCLTCPDCRKKDAGHYKEFKCEKCGEVLVHLCDKKKKR